MRYFPSVACVHPVRTAVSIDRIVVTGRSAPDALGCIVEVGDPPFRIATVRTGGQHIHELPEADHITDRSDASS
jgi:hypothetical protein